ncbi:class I SAM-dependent methyltransferase [Legionella longbeachae]|uniref:class I SAM-dependent methyltransferase n=1 Tax=Legionella longbeachae TaxID=450 RepID=UPI001244B9B2|nr:class I SAM-dependent methyltransferase [Legionella longbeachae]QEY50096.1 class I SAM-dependent methyltransferase [Legionella longbeachae]QEY50226.1 class I SAM-dependent methyltransferase [Legionella longbeachae]
MIVNERASYIQEAEIHKSSFRDPCAQVYLLNGEIYRQINEPGLSDYQQLMSSGLYGKLQSKKYLVSHEEVALEFALNKQAHVVLKPEQINFISYCYEWSFTQFKDAALLTLEIAKLAIKYGMILKDASTHNIQFHYGKPIFIDTSSFSRYQEGEPWIAYNQFCRHFLAPLLLMAQVDVRMGKLSQHHIDGIPLDLASKLLPFKNRFSFSIFAHIYAHAKMQKKYSDVINRKYNPNRKVSKISLLGLLDNLSSLIKKLTWFPIKTEWGDYYNQTNYSNDATKHKAEIVKSFFIQSKADSVWDLGGNNGYYSRIVAEAGATSVVCFDIDPMAVETNYQKAKKDKCQSILPLLQDLTNPSSSLGWQQKERDGLLERSGRVDLIMALALVHHLAISNNVPLERIADYFSRLGTYLIIEFVPKEDSQVQRLLASRADIFPDYYLECFKTTFAKYFTILEEKPILETSRTLLLMKKIGK